MALRRRPWLCADKWDSSGVPSLPQAPIASTLDRLRIFPHFPIPVNIHRESMTLNPHDLAQISERMRSEGRSLVFTNGCFDLLHVGHVRYLAEARALGDALVVAVNSDDSVRALKGPQRPLNSEEDRAEVLLGLKSVDYVTIFEDARVTSLIREIRPACYAKGGDYTLETLDAGERAALEETGTRIHLLPLVPGRSTTSLIKKMEAAE